MPNADDHPPRQTRKNGGAGGGKPLDGASGHSAAAVSEYVADLCGGLIEMASRTGLDDLAYLLDLARLEADNARRRYPPK